MEIERARAEIRRELQNAEAALRIGNQGKARVCARRGAGIAIGYWLERHSGDRWGMDAMSRLAHVREDPTLPENVRAAALRLTTRITEQFTLPFSTSPLDDCRVIAGYFLEQE